MDLHAQQCSPGSRSIAGHDIVWLHEQDEGGVDEKENEDVTDFDLLPEGKKANLRSDDRSFREQEDLRWIYAAPTRVL